jgi:NADH-quinone oxidoreductase subunit L
MLLIGAVAKSAQIPLYTWLPDAMEGPTPVSALIHAATMVTAGVYLIARSNVLFQLAPTALASVAIIGAVGGMYAASIGLVQVDIKQVLAYSTISQIAYMFLACGVGAYAVGIFHLMTHAFFKALLFMAAGNVIHALAGEQDMRLMGGLRGKLRWSYGLMLIGCLAISGIPPLAGFFSKDDILGRVLAAGNWHVVLWGIGVIAAGMTAFYMFRLFYLTFHGTYNGPREVYEHAHEAPRVMIVPAAILGVLSILGGWVQIPGVSNTFDDFLQPVFMRYAAAHVALPAPATNWLAMGVALAAALVGIGLASYMYGGPVRRPYPGLRPLYQLLFNKYYVDEIYDEIFVVPVRNGARILYSIVDRETIDGLVNGVAGATRRVSLGLSPIQSGYVRAYALSIFVGVVLVALVPMVFGIVGGSQ